MTDEQPDPPSEVHEDHRKVRSWIVCDECGGSGTCPMCDGDGDGINCDCRWCDNVGSCPECYGEGSYDPFGES
jgi:hypothetical protein